MGDAFMLPVGPDPALQIFKEIDTNGDGFLNKTELQAALQKRGLSEHSLQDLMNQLDVNGDGKVSQDEFCQRYMMWKYATSGVHPTGLSKATMEALEPVPLADAAESAWQRFADAGIKPRKRAMAVEEYIEQEPEEKGSLAWWQWKVATILEGKVGQWTLAALVSFNAVLIGIEADHGNESNVDFFAALEIAMVLIFTLELVFRMFALGMM